MATSAEHGAPAGDHRRIVAAIDQCENAADRGFRQQAEQGCRQLGEMDADDQAADEAEPRLRLGGDRRIIDIRPVARIAVEAVVHQMGKAQHVE